MKKQAGLGLCMASLLMTCAARADVFMDAAWAKQMCDAWNKSDVLTTQLVETDDGYEWMKNDAGRGYKLVQMYRTNCKEYSKVQLNIALEREKAKCVYGGRPDNKVMDMNVDYVIHANDRDWDCIGQTSFGCGAMGAMMTGKLKFAGPKMEVMSVMEPFDSFLAMTGAVSGDKSVCPPPPPIDVPEEMDGMNDHSGAGNIDPVVEPVITESPSTTTEPTTLDDPTTTEDHAVATDPSTS